MRQRISIITLVTVLLVTFAPMRATRAATLVVTSTADSGTATLRNAIASANSGDTITFGVSGTIILNSTLPTITKALTINGAGQNVTISGGNSVEIMAVVYGGNLSLNAVTISNGNPFGQAVVGGAIQNSGTLNVTNSTFTNNSAISVGGIGGAIGNLFGTANIANSTFSGNTAGPYGDGGAIGGFGTVNITNTTFSGNSATYGGAISINGTTIINNSLLTKSTGADCYNSGTFMGANNLSDGSCPGTIATATNIASTLANNGGPTQTFALLSGSDAIDAVPNGKCVYVSSGTNSLFSNGAPIATDQRGVSRPQGPLCDIGAYEATSTTPPIGCVGLSGSPVSQTFSVKWASSNPKETQTYKYDVTLKGEICSDALVSTDLTDPNNPEITIRSSSQPYGIETTVIARDGSIETTLAPHTTYSSPIPEAAPTITFSSVGPSVFFGVKFTQQIQGSGFTLTKEQTTSRGFTLLPPLNSPDYLIAVAIVISPLVLLVTPFVPVAAPVVAPVAAFLLALAPAGAATSSTIIPASRSSPAIVAPLNQYQGSVGLSQPVLTDLQTVFSPEFMSFTATSSLTVDSGLKLPGQDILYGGSNFTPNGAVDLHLIVPGDQSFAVESEIQANADGTISGKVRLPVTAQPGHWLLAAIDRQSMANTLYAFANGKTTALQFYLAANEVTIPPYIRVSIDVKPDSDPPNIELGSKGTVPVAVLSSSTFDATKVDPATIMFAGAPVATDPKGKLMASFEDVNRDGLLDLVVHFNTQALKLNPSDSQVVLTGQTFDGDIVVGVDSVQIVSAQGNPASPQTAPTFQLGD